MVGFIPYFTGGIAYAPWLNHRIDMDERYEVSLNDLWDIKPLRFADIALVIYYRPWFLPINRKKVFRFITHKGQDGKLRWYAYPTGEAPPPSYVED